MKMLAMLALIRIIKETDRDYFSHKEHGSLGYLKSNYKKSVLLNGIKSAFADRRDNTKGYVDPLTLVMSRVESGGNHNIASFRTLLVHKLYHHLELGEVTLERLILNPKWREVRDAVYNRLAAIRESEEWQANFGLDFTTVDDLQKARGLISSKWFVWLGLQSFDPMKDRHSLVENSKQILAYNPDANYEENYKQLVDIFRGSGVAEPITNRMLVIAENAFEVLKITENGRLMYKLDFNYNPLPNDAVEFWAQHIVDYDLSSLLKGVAKAIVEAVFDDPDREEQHQRGRREAEAFQAQQAWQQPVENVQAQFSLQRGLSRQDQLKLLNRCMLVFGLKDAQDIRNFGHGSYKMMRDVIKAADVELETKRIMAKILEEAFNLLCSYQQDSTSFARLQRSPLSDDHVAYWQQNYERFATAGNIFRAMVSWA